MNLPPPAQIMVARTVHARHQPFRRAFAYAVTMVRLDVDRLREAGSLTPLFGVNRGWAFAFHEKDHGERRSTSAGRQRDSSAAASAPPAPLRTWAESRFARAGIDASRGRLELISFPRVLGYGFSPISIWISHDRAGGMQGAIFEVHNTFGETHAYVGAFSASSPRGQTDKTFFVSPFFDVSGGYRFALTLEDSSLDLVIENWRDGQRQHFARLSGECLPMTTGNLFRRMAASPLSGHGAMAGILFQALRLWRKGAKYQERPAADDARTTVVETVARAPRPAQAERLMA